MIANGGYSFTAKPYAESFTLILKIALWDGYYYYSTSQMSKPIFFLEQITWLGKVAPGVNCPTSTS